MKSKSLLISLLLLAGIGIIYLSWERGKVAVGVYPRWTDGPGTGTADSRWKTVREREKIDPHWQGKMPIDFFGRVEDFDGTPIPGATISFEWTTLSTAGTERSTTTTDATGNFSLHGAIGKFLGVTVAKQGYYSSRANRHGFEFAEFSDAQFYQPDPGKPVVFRLREEGTKAKVGHRQTLYGLKTDGTPQYIDLRTGTKTTGGPATGDLEIRLVRGTPDAAHRFDWTFEAAAVAKGGLVESADEFMFEAPENGYVPMVQIAQPMQAPGYQRQLARSFYIRLADGQTYGKIVANIRPEYDHAGAVDLDIYVNLEGTRNLEVDRN